MDKMHEINTKIQHIKDRLTALDVEKSQLLNVLRELEGQLLSSAPPEPSKVQAIYNFATEEKIVIFQKKPMIKTILIYLLLQHPVRKVRLL